MIQKFPDLKFYEALKNSQPIVFLASFSMIIAAFSFSKEEISGVYDNAVLSSIMFLISFGFSLLDQLIPKKPNDDDIWIRGSKFFFFIIGLLYLALIALEFSKLLPQTFIILIYWGIIVIGLSFFSIIYFKKGKFDPKFYYNRKHYIFVSIIGSLSSLSFIAIGAFSIGNVIFRLNLSKEILETVSLILLITAAIGFFIEFGVIVTIQKRKKKIKAKNLSSQDKNLPDSEEKS